MLIFNTIFYEWGAQLVSQQPIPLLAAANTEEGYDKAIVGALVITAAIIFIFSIVLGEICTRFGLPSVLADLTTGVLLGTSVLGLLIFSQSGGEANSLLIQFLEFTTGTSSTVAQEAYKFQMEEYIDESANVGLLALLFTTGLESNLRDLIRVGSQAATVALTGVVLPFALGTLVLMKIFAVATIPAVFAGAALTATSIGITAKVLKDIGRLQSDEGQIIIGAAILDDILGIVVLAVVLSLVKTGEVEIINIFYLIASAIAFVLVAVVLNRLFGSLFVSIIDRLSNPAALMLLALVFLNTFALSASAIGLEAILGAFAAGLVLGETKFQEKLEQLFRPFVYVYTTIFFVTIGAKIDLSVLNPAIPENRQGLIIAACLIAIAIFGKILAGFAVITKEPVNRLAIGFGMIPRGEVGLVFAGLGAASGVLSNSLDAGIIIMVIVTTLVAPLLLRIVFSENSTLKTQESE
ncbi:cation:proton antiporter [Mastigocoleus sp. MO_188.B34]|uniref:cation:proton antiporter n=1 Tax=Mastigocoleus sp. MO_188.B34 TaxID=3036635 RepID=UPI002628F4F4|nr:cation:proton antiporter [Mastigocoleus sp. MO_188.B34]MDJ0692850.1 cation:proton antiporter [Mastigocoleus sp. MO_188.B34]